MSKTAFLFPGQGAQYVGMGKDLYENYPCSKTVFDKANSVLNRNITEICFWGDENNLKQTINTQPCIVTTCIAILEALKSELDICPDYVAGHSLGEYSAMYCANVMDFKNTILAIQKRAELMSKVLGGSMAAVIGASEEQLQNGLNEGRKIGYVDIANYNSPVQIVITGDDDAVKVAGDYLIANGVRKVIPLAVSGAFHSKYMDDASNTFKEFVKDLDLKDATIPVITNVDADFTIHKEDFRVKMPKQINSSVYWTQTIQKMIASGVDTFVEIGPGKVLAGLNKKISQDIITHNIYDMKTLKSTVEILK